MDMFMFMYIDCVFFVRVYAVEYISCTRTLRRAAQLVDLYVHRHVVALNSITKMLPLIDHEHVAAGWT